MYDGKSTKLEKKVWLSSPTMHGEELKYMKEAFDTNWMSTIGANVNEPSNLLDILLHFVRGGVAFC